jgi:hypothetical protein
MTAGNQLKGKIQDRSSSESGGYTYHCADSSCWSWTGGESGEQLLIHNGDKATTQKQNASSNWGCRFVYAVGVCHQENHQDCCPAIASGGVGRYWLTGPTFRTYGEAISWTACKTCWLLIIFLQG